MAHSKKVSDFLTDQKIPVPDRTQTNVLVSGEDIVWVIGVRIDHRFRVTEQTREVIGLAFVADE